MRKIITLPLIFLLIFSLVACGADTTPTAPSAPAPVAEPVPEPAHDPTPEPTPEPQQNLGAELEGNWNQGDGAYLYYFLTSEWIYFTKTGNGEGRILDDLGEWGDWTVDTNGTLAITGEESGYFEFTFVVNGDTLTIKDSDGDERTFSRTTESLLDRPPDEAPAGLLDPEDGIHIHKDEHVTISYLGCETDRDRDYMVFYVENNTDVELTFQSNTLSIDGESLGHISGSDSIAAQSKGRVRFRTGDPFPTMSPATITGTLRVIDFSRELFRSYDVSFVNLRIRESDDDESSGASQEGVAVHKDEYVNIRYLECIMDRDREYMVFYVENNTDVELTFQANTLSINGESLGRVSGSDSIAAQSRGRVRFRTDSSFPTMTPSTITGTLRVIDFSRELFRSYDVSFVNLEVE